ncbi:hypothetical protein QR685DRAFT_524354, partial [Neurospora intermedia]
MVPRALFPLMPDRVFLDLSLLLFLLLPRRPRSSPSVLVAASPGCFLGGSKRFTDWFANGTFRSIVYMLFILSSLHSHEPGCATLTDRASMTHEAEHLLIKKTAERRGGSRAPKGCGTVGTFGAVSCHVHCE